MPREPVTRRRALTILAAAGACATAAGRAAAFAGGDRNWEWRGVAMGSDARLVFAGVDAATARAAAAAAEAEIERLEAALSLYRDDSQIRRLNRDGTLAAPSGDLARAVRLACDIAAATGGLFDPTVQALWESYADWFAADPAAGVPPRSRIAAARAAVDWRCVSVAPDRVTLGPGQRITLNGLGQGYVTDRVAELLRARGFTHVLVDLGEQRALGPQPDGAPWQIARADVAPIRLASGALATSEGRGCILGAAGAVHHLFDPRTGASAQHWRRLTVQHASAAVADGLSTALSIADHRQLPAIVRTMTGVRVWATDHAGRELRWRG